MTITLECPHCGKTIRTSDANAGKRDKCPSCGGVTVIPDERVEEVVEEDSEEEFYNPYAEEPAGSVMPPLAIALAVGAALVGSVLWAGLLVGMDYQLGWLAWGIGGLVGVAALKGGGRGVPMAVTAAVLVAFSIFGGKWVGYKLMIDAEYEAQVEEVLDSSTLRVQYREMQSDSKAWSEFSEPPSDEVLAEYMFQRRFTEATDASGVTPEELEYFRREQAPWLVDFSARSPSMEEWTREIEAEIRAQGEDAPIMDFVIEDLDLIDLIFAVLGISTAWGLVMRNNTNSIGGRRRRRTGTESS